MFKTSNCCRATMAEKEGSSDKVLLRFLICIAHHGSMRRGTKKHESRFLLTLFSGSVRTLASTSIRKLASREHPWYSCGRLPLIIPESLMPMRFAACRVLWRALRSKWSASLSELWSQQPPALSWWPPDLQIEVFPNSSLKFNVTVCQFNVVWKFLVCSYYLCLEVFFFYGHLLLSGWTMDSFPHILRPVRHMVDGIGLHQAQGTLQLQAAIREHNLDLLESVLHLEVQRVVQPYVTTSCCMTGYNGYCVLAWPVLCFFLGNWG